MTKLQIAENDAGCWHVHYDGDSIKSLIETHFGSLHLLTISNGEKESNSEVTTLVEYAITHKLARKISAKDFFIEWKKIDC